MIITRTPFRVSFVGGGSDARWYFQSHGRGAVLSVAIAHYMYIVIHPYFHENRIRLKYSETEDITSVDQIKHRIIRACLERFNLSGGVEIASFADVPASSGLGSSSAFTVGLLHALYAWHGKVVSKSRLAEEACEIEIDVLREPIGKQDQYAVAFGGAHVFEFNRDDSVSAIPVAISNKAKGQLEKRLRLYYISSGRAAADVLKHQNAGPDQNKTAERIGRLVNLVEPLKSYMESGKLECVGQILHEAWMIKRGLTAGTSNGVIDGHYQRALGAGATGGKLLGAGGGGFLLLDSPNQDALGTALGLRSLPFVIDNDGSRLIFFEPNDSFGPL